MKRNEIRVEGVNKMEVEDLKIGYVLEMKDGNFAMVLPTDGYQLCVSGEGTWFPLERFDEDLCYDTSKVVKVWGLTTPRLARHITSENRDLLWEREIPKVEMTIEQIERRLGFEIKIVKE